jgi:hypothetical protein
MHAVFSCENPEKRQLDVGRMMVGIIFILRKYAKRAWFGFIWLTIETSVRLLCTR